MDCSTTTRAKVTAGASHVCSRHLYSSVLQFMTVPTPTATKSGHSDQSGSLPRVSFTSTNNIPIAVMFGLLVRALYFQKEFRPPLTFPFVETKQSFTNHPTKCKISKQFDIADLMKWAHTSSPQLQEKVSSITDAEPRHDCPTSHLPVFGPVNISSDCVVLHFDCTQPFFPHTIRNN